MMGLILWNTEHPNSTLAKQWTISFKTVFISGTFLNTVIVEADSSDCLKRPPWGVWEAHTECPAILDQFQLKFGLEYPDEKCENS